MQFSKSHPCNTFGWLFVPTALGQRAMQKQLEMVAEEVKKDRNFSGEPPAFLSWSQAQIGDAAAADPSIARQIGSRIADLDARLTKLEGERQMQIEAYQRSERQVIEEIEMLIQLLPQPCE